MNFNKKIHFFKIKLKDSIFLKSVLLKKTGLDLKLKKFEFYKWLKENFGNNFFNKFKKVEERERRRIIFKKFSKNIFNLKISLNAMRFFLRIHRTFYRFFLRFKSLSFGLLSYKVNSVLNGPISLDLEFALGTSFGKKFLNNFLKYFGSKFFWGFGGCNLQVSKVAQEHRNFFTFFYWPFTYVGGLVKYIQSNLFDNKAINLKIFFINRTSGFQGLEWFKFFIVNHVSLSKILNFFLNFCIKKKEIYVRFELKQLMRRKKYIKAFKLNLKKQFIRVYRYNKKINSYKAISYKYRLDWLLVFKKYLNKGLVSRRIVSKFVNFKPKFSYFRNNVKIWKSSRVNQLLLIKKKGLNHFYKFFTGSFGYRVDHIAKENNFINLKKNLAKIRNKVRLKYRKWSVPKKVLKKKKKFRRAKRGRKLSFKKPRIKSSKLKLRFKIKYCEFLLFLRQNFYFYVMFLNFQNRSQKFCFEFLLVYIRIFCTFLVKLRSVNRLLFNWLNRMKRLFKKIFMFRYIVSIVQRIWFIYLSYFLYRTLSFSNYSFTNKLLKQAITSTAIGYYVAESLRRRFSPLEIFRKIRKKLKYSRKRYGDKSFFSKRHLNPKGFLLIFSGRFWRRQRRSSYTIFKFGKISTRNLSSGFVDYSFNAVRLPRGICGVSIYIFR